MESILRQIRQGIVPKDQEIRAEQREFWQQINFNFLHDVTADTEEIILHGNGSCYKKGALGLTPISPPLGPASLQAGLELMALKNETSWNYTSPFTSFYTSFAGQSVRVSLIHYSCSPDKFSHAFFRFLGQSVRAVEDFCLSDRQRLLLQEMVEQKKNVLICGATGSGKTSLLSSLIHHFEPNEHLLLVEDTPELACRHANVTRLLAQPGQAKSMQSYLTYGMRMSPDRIVLGELRSLETIAYLMALNTGHRGCWSTIHANGPIDAIDRLCLLFNLYNDKHLANDFVMKLACNALDAIVFVQNKKIQRITRIINFHNSKIIHEDWPNG